MRQDRAETVERTHDGGPRAHPYCPETDEGMRSLDDLGTCGLGAEVRPVQTGDTMSDYDRDVL